MAYFVPITLGKVVVDASIGWSAATSGAQFAAGEITKAWIVQGGHVVASEFAKQTVLNGVIPLLSPSAGAAAGAAAPAAAATGATITIGGVVATAAVAGAAIGVIVGIAILIHFAREQALRDAAAAAAAAAARTGPLWDAARGVVYAGGPLEGWANTVKTSDAFKEVIAAIGVTGGTAADVKTILPRIFTELRGAVSGSRPNIPRQNGILKGHAETIRGKPLPNPANPLGGMEQAAAIFAALTKTGGITVTPSGVSVNPGTNIDTLLDLARTTDGRKGEAAVVAACARLGVDSTGTDFENISKLVVPAKIAATVEQGRQHDAAALRASSAAADVASRPGRTTGSMSAPHPPPAPPPPPAAADGAEAARLARAAAHAARVEAARVAVPDAPRPPPPPPAADARAEADRLAQVAAEARAEADRLAAEAAASVHGVASHSAAKEQKRAFHAERAAAAMRAGLAERELSEAAAAAAAASTRAAAKAEAAAQMAGLAERASSEAAAAATAANSRAAAKASAKGAIEERQKERVLALKKTHLRGLTALLHYLGLMRGKEPINDVIRYMRNQVIEKAEVDANAGVEAPNDHYQVDIAAAGLQLIGLNISPFDIAAVKELLGSNGNATLGDIATAAERAAASVAAVRADKPVPHAARVVPPVDGRPAPPAGLKAKGVGSSGPSGSGPVDPPSFGFPHEYAAPAAAAPGLGLPPGYAAPGLGPPPVAGLGFPPGYVPAAAAPGLGAPPVAGLGFPPGYVPAAAAPGLGAPPAAGLGLPPGYVPPAARVNAAVAQADYERRQRENAARAAVPAGRARAGWGRGGRKSKRRSASRKLRSRRSSRRRQNATRLSRRSSHK